MRTPGSGWSTSTRRPSAASGNGRGRGPTSPRLTDRLAEAGAAAIAYDIVLSEPDRTSPPRLAERLPLDAGAKATLARLPDNDAQLARVVRARAGHHRLFPDPRPAPPHDPAQGGVRHFRDRADRPGAVRQRHPALARGCRGGERQWLRQHRRRTATPSSARAPLIARNGNAICAVAVARRVARGAGRGIGHRQDQRRQRRIGRRRRRGVDQGRPVRGADHPRGRPVDALHRAGPRARTIPAWKILSGALRPGPVAAAGRRTDHLRRRRRDRAARPGLDPAAGPRAGGDGPCPGRRADDPRPVPGPARLGARAGDGMLLLVLGIGLAVLLPRIGALRGALVGGGAIVAARRGQLVRLHRPQFPARPDLAGGGGDSPPIWSRRSSPSTARNGSAPTFTTPSTAISRPNWSSASPTTRICSSWAGSSAT